MHAGSQADGRQHTQANPPYHILHPCLHSFQRWILTACHTAGPVNAWHWDSQVQCIAQPPSMMLLSPFLMMICRNWSPLRGYFIKQSRTCDLQTDVANDDRHQKEEGDPVLEQPEKPSACR